MSKQFDLTAKEVHQTTEKALERLECEKSQLRESFTESLLESLNGYITNYSAMGKFKVGVSVSYYSFRNKAKKDLIQVKSARMSLRICLIVL